MKRALFTISIIALIALVGCKHDLQMAITELNGGSDTTIINPPPPVDTMICFESQILPLFVSSCAKSGCHDAITAEKDYILTSYQAIMEEIVPFNPNDSKFLEVMLLPATENDAMPPLPSPRMTAEQIALITPSSASSDRVFAVIQQYWMIANTKFLKTEARLLFCSV